MPELPDVEIYCERLADLVVGRTLKSIRLASPFVLRSDACRARAKSRSERSSPRQAHRLCRQGGELLYALPNGREGPRGSCAFAAPQRELAADARGTGAAHPPWPPISGSCWPETGKLKLGWVTFSAAEDRRASILLVYPASGLRLGLSGRMIDEPHFEGFLHGFRAG